MPECFVGLVKQVQTICTIILILFHLSPPPELDTFLSIIHLEMFLHFCLVKQRNWSNFRKCLSCIFSFHFLFSVRALSAVSFDLIWFQQKFRGKTSERSTRNTKKVGKLLKIDRLRHLSLFQRNRKSPVLT